VECKNSTRRKEGKVKMKLYKINYTFTGNGTAFVKANDEEEAEENFQNGEWEQSPEEEWENKDIIDIEEVKND